MLHCEFWRAEKCLHSLARDLCFGGFLARPEREQLSSCNSSDSTLQFPAPRKCCTWKNFALRTFARVCKECTTISRTRTGPSGLVKCGKGFDARSSVFLLQKGSPFLSMGEQVLSLLCCVSSTCMMCCLYMWCTKTYINGPHAPCALTIKIINNLDARRSVSVADISLYTVA